MLTSQKCGGLICPFDSLKKQNRITPPKKKQLNLHLPYDPIIPLPGIYPREMKTQAHKSLLQECS